ncbi:MAG: threonine synthase [Alphaproteobacteria bacterium]|nr:threonine synthase [Alphaproteobacteria bacterium]
MRYVSTRGTAPVLDFEGALLAGLARDGGLYVPAKWPRLGKPQWRALAGLSYAEAALHVMQPFVGAAFSRRELEQDIEAAYAGFGHRAVAPLVQLAPERWLLELFHGPTLAFKDYALQLLGRLFDRALKRRRRRVTILGATSGDTGSAAIEAFRDSPVAEIVMLHPKGRVSEVQRRQMTTVLAPNVRNVAIAGTFDDCQALVKAAFVDLAFRDAMNLSAVNSINWARVMAQTVYYAVAAVALGAPGRAVAFSVPTGNFGDVFAGYVARRMGLPVSRLMVATNRNDILARFFATGEYRSGRVSPTHSPSMDIQVASNFERLLFDLQRRDGAATARLMRSFERERRMAVARERLAEARRLFDSRAVDERATLATIARVWKENALLLDPHSAVGVAAAETMTEAPVVALATAHPAKFPDAVERATGRRPELPPRLADLLGRPERCVDLPNDLGALQAYMRDTQGRAP